MAIAENNEKKRKEKKKEKREKKEEKRKKKKKEEKKRKKCGRTGSRTRAPHLKTWTSWSIFRGLSEFGLCRRTARKMMKKHKEFYRSIMEDYFRDRTLPDGGQKVPLSWCSVLPAALIFTGLNALLWSTATGRKIYLASLIGGSIFTVTYMGVRKAA